MLLFGFNVFFSCLIKVMQLAAVIMRPDCTHGAQWFLTLMTALFIHATSQRFVYRELTVRVIIVLSSSLS